MHIPSASHDGYIRLSLSHLGQVPLIHLDSALDDDMLEELRIRTVPAEAAGYSEWCSNTVPVLSIGWTWFKHSHSRELVQAPEAVRSNVMLIDKFGYDLGAATTSLLFGTWLATHNWKPVVESHVGLAHPLLS